MSDLDPAAAALDAAAEDAGVSREELLRRALVALAESEDIDIPDAEEVAAIEARLDDLDAELDEKVADLRERFIDLYREVEALDADEGDASGGDEGAAATRIDDLAAELEEIAARLDRLDAAVADAPSSDRVDDLGDRLDALDARLDELDAVRDQLDEVDGHVDEVDERVDDVEADLAGISGEDLAEIDGKLSRVANAVVRVKRRLDAAERDRADRERIDALTRTANRHGVRTADCDHCGGGVELGLLSAPECPHCGRLFEDIEPSTGFLGTSKLLVGDRPAIDGDVADGDSAEGTQSPDRTASDGGAGGEER
ncbi:hypothetical protein C463_05080 [Halorubrum californiense DSM 19288]|uniref:Uncharacterized protein n=1 Tax=Halorubrum californiense DSM 19288 TaxID=1227465 RepID=M0EFW4_9EURY|nr:MULTISPECIES: hypothetical protein [Halorubrum]ELZ45782.1 hypothetical protein C463_05080 [Halorubrum californiense DSM 19288]TKX67808.1 hypothetical protein EXE40_14345 [Halorubrum sp. GN11GM_10-3_MGM]